MHGGSVTGGVQWQRQSLVKLKYRKHRSTAINKLRAVSLVLLSDVLRIIILYYSTLEYSFSRGSMTQSLIKVSVGFLYLVLSSFVRIVLY